MLKLKKILAVVLALIMLLALSSTALATSATDVDGHWAKDLIEKYTNAGIFSYASGDSKTGFKYEPNKPLTRGDLVIALDEILDWQQRGEDLFTDLIGDTANHKWTNYETYQGILKAVAAGVIKGYSDGTVKPEGTITRQEAVVMLCRAFDIEGIEGKTTFTDDAQIGDWARGQVAAFVEKGYLKGYPDGSFKPQGTITRAEILSVIDKMGKDYTAIAERAAGPVVYDYEDYKVATVDTWDNGDYSKDATGTKDIMVRLYKPKGVEENAPVLVWVHGGAWIRGSYDTSINTYLLKACMENGIAFASVGYRLEQEASSPCGIHDIKGCIRFLRAHADELGLNADNIGVAGSSAGASYANLVVTSGDVAELEGDVGGNTEYSSEVQYGVILFGVSDFINCFQQTDLRINSGGAMNGAYDGLDNVVPAIFGLDDVGLTVKDIVKLYEKGDTTDPNWKYVQRVLDMSPLYWLSANDPACFIYHGTEDPLIPCAQGVQMYGRMRELGIESEIRVAAFCGHSFSHPVYMQEAIDWMVDRALSGQN